MRYLDEETTRRCLPMRDAIGSMRSAFTAEVELPRRALVGSSMFMPGRVGETTGIKVVSTIPGNPAGIVALFAGDGTPLGLVDGPTITSIRTGAVAGMATDLLADESATSMTLFGAGAMAADQVQAVRSVRPDIEILVWSRDPRNAVEFAASIDATPIDDAVPAVSRADIITTITPSRRPLFTASNLRANVHVNAMGAFAPDMIEIPTELTAAAFVVVDDFEAASHEAGDLLQANRTPDVDLRDLLSTGIRPSGPTLFKSVGVASQDVAAAAMALANAESAGWGTVL